MAEYAEYEPKGDWETVPCQGDGEDSLIMVTLRTDVDKFRSNPRYNIRVTVSWRYACDGMPSVEISQQMQQVTEALTVAFDRDPVAVLTGIYTGDGLREWVFYTLSLNIFRRKFNEQLMPLPVLPITIAAESDPEWAEYAEASQALLHG